jgi:transcriptional regulator GlxA family with amidase domain
MLSRRAALMAGTCTGTALLAQAGLLAQRRATTCWWMVDWFRSSFPDVKLDAEPLVVADGDRWTAAAGSAYIHLGLQLVGRFAGDKAAAATARLMLVERRRGSQSPFLDTDRPAIEPQDVDVTRLMRFLERNAHTELTIDDACRRMRLNARTLSRNFQSALGMSPLTYLQSCRIARAKRLLQETASPLDEIVGQCGYEDASSFRKLFARHVGMTPREYRARFGQ